MEFSLNFVSNLMRQSEAIKEIKRTLENEAMSILTSGTSL